MDHLSHSLSGQSSSTHHQSHLHRRSRPSTLRLQGRLSRRIIRRHSSHCLPSDLRGCLCSPPRRRHSRPEQTSAKARRLGTTRNTTRNVMPARDSRSPAATASHSQISATLPRPPFPRSRPALPLIMREALGLRSFRGNHMPRTKVRIRASLQRCHQRHPNDRGFSRLVQSAFGWRSAFSAAVLAPLESWALAPGASSRCSELPDVRLKASFQPCRNPNFIRAFRRHDLSPRLPHTTPKPNPPTLPPQL